MRLDSQKCHCLLRFVRPQVTKNNLPIPKHLGIGKSILQTYEHIFRHKKCWFFSLSQSAGPSKESKADKRKKDKKAGKGSGANRPVSGKSGRRETQTSKGQYQNQNNPCAPEGGKSRDQDNIFQPKQNMDENKGSKTNFTNQNSSVSQERGDRKKDDIDSEETANDLVNSSDKHTDEASNLEPDSVEDNSSKEGISKNEGTTIFYDDYYSRNQP